MQRITVILLVLSFIFWPIGASAAKIGVVDGEKLFDNYPGVLDAQKKITGAQDKLRDAITESEKIYTEFEKQKKSEAEKLTKKKELQETIDTKAEETKKLIETISIKIEDDIIAAINKVAKQRGLEIVFDKRAVLTGGVDVTEDVSKILQKNQAPVAKNSTKKLNLKKNKKTN